MLAHCWKCAWNIHVPLCQPSTSIVYQAEQEQETGSPSQPRPCQAPPGAAARTAGPSPRGPERPPLLPPPRGVAGA